MFFDLNVPVQVHASRKTNPLFTPTQVAAVEARIDLLVHLGYTVVAFNQTVEKRIDPKTHVNVVDPLLSLLKHRPGIVYLKRLTIQVDEDSEKGFGLTSANAALAGAYDLLALAPTTATTFSLACLTHSQPSALTAHIIALPLTLPRLPFHLKHTLVRTALRNGAVFEINYAGALEEGGKRNWWAAAREVVRATKGKGIVVSGGVVGEGEYYRGPKDVENLITLLGLAQNLAHDACTVTPKSLVLRAQTRKTYRAVFSEPKVVVPPSSEAPPTTTTEPALCEPRVEVPSLSSDHVATNATPEPSKKRTCEHDPETPARKKKRKKVVEK